jgi:hypothetical protein
MKTIFALLLALCHGAAAIRAQDPLKVAPQNYKMEFENDWVRVVRVHYGPKESVGPHDHSEYATAYVYLNDAGPVKFKHIGLSYGAITRPDVKAGSFRLYKAVKEIHEVENISDTATDFLRVEFKTDPVEPNTLRGKYFREDASADGNFEKMQFENAQVRITRMIIAPGKSLNLAATASEPALLLSLTPAQFTITAAKTKASKFPMEPGKTLWLATGEQKQCQNSGASPAELLRFELKTKPIKINSKEKEKPHSHSHD